MKNYPHKKNATDVLEIEKTNWIHIHEQKPLNEYLQLQIGKKKILKWKEQILKKGWLQLFFFMKLINSKKDV